MAPSTRVTQELSLRVCFNNTRRALPCGNHMRYPICYPRSLVAIWFTKSYLSWQIGRCISLKIRREEAMTASVLHKGDAGGSANGLGESVRRVSASNRKSFPCMCLKDRVVSCIPRLRAISATALFCRVRPLRPLPPTQEVSRKRSYLDRP